MTDNHRISWASIDVGFDVKLHDMPIDYPEWAGPPSVVVATIGVAAHSRCGATHWLGDFERCLAWALISNTDP